MLQIRRKQRPKGCHAQGCSTGSAWALVALVLAASVLQCSSESTAYEPERLRREFRLAVCVVGQVARTEVQSKIENLVMPNTYLSGMHVFLVLQTGQARFTNKASEAQCTAAPESLDEATAAFNSYVPTTASEYEFTQYDVNEWQFPGYPDSAAAKKTRLTNHINQWITWRKCSKMVEKHELETGKTFHAVLRIRDNAIVLEPFNVLDRLLQLQDELHKQYPKTYRRASLQASPGDIRNLPVVTKACSSWRGVADKLMLVPRNHMDHALGGMADQFFLVRENHTRPMVVNNPEGFVKYALEMYNVPHLAEEDPSMLPITDGRCEEGDRFCVVSQKKDCRPWNHSWKIKECQGSYSNTAYAIRNFLGQFFGTLKESTTGKLRAKKKKSLKTSSTLTKKTKSSTSKTTSKKPPPSPSSTKSRPSPPSSSSKPRENAKAPPTRTQAGHPRLIYHVRTVPRPLQQGMRVRVSSRARGTFEG